MFVPKSGPVSFTVRRISDVNDKPWENLNFRKTKLIRIPLFRPVHSPAADHCRRFRSRADVPNISRVPSIIILRLCVDSYFILYFFFVCVCVCLRFFFYFLLLFIPAGSLILFFVFGGRGIKKKNTVAPPRDRIEEGRRDGDDDDDDDDEGRTGENKCHFQLFSPTHTHPYPLHYSATRLTSGWWRDGMENPTRTTFDLAEGSGVRGVISTFLNSFNASGGLGSGVSFIKRITLRYVVL